MLKEFREFAMRGNVVDLAVGVIIVARLARLSLPLSMTFSRHLWDYSWAELTLASKPLYSEKLLSNGVPLYKQSSTSSLSPLLFSSSLNFQIN